MDNLLNMFSITTCDITVNCETDTDTDTRRYQLNLSLQISTGHTRLEECLQFEHDQTGGVFLLEVELEVEEIFWLKGRKGAM